MDERVEEIKPISRIRSLGKVAPARPRGGRHNITDEMRKYLIGKRLEMGKMFGANNVASTRKKRLGLKCCPNLP